MSESHVIPNPGKRGAMAPADNASFDTVSADPASDDTAAPDTASADTVAPASISPHSPGVVAADADREVVDAAGFETGAAGSDSASVRRGIQRLFARYGVWLLPEMPLRNGRRADLMGVDAQGRVIIIEIKVQRGDLLGDSKWQDYLDYCDRFFWGVSTDIDRTILDRDIFRPDRCGIVVADGYDGEIVRPASLKPLAPARRKTETERLARAAMRRMTVATDPHCATWGGSE